jgi:hypothetical protein
MSSRNACQGLPDGPCPTRCCDSTVLYTIYDLFLCSSCVLAREQLNKDVITAVPAARDESTKPTRAKHRKAGPTVVRSTRAKQTHDDDAGAEHLPSACNDIKERCNNDDGSENEMEVKSVCLQCARQIIDDTNTLVCDVCSAKCHLNCIALPEKLRNPFFRTLEYIGWVCEDCKTSAQHKLIKLTSALSEMTEDIIRMKAMITDLTSRMNQTENSRQQPQEQQLQDRPVAAVQSGVRPFDNCTTVEDINTDSNLTDSRDRVTNEAGATSQDFRMIVHRTLHDLNLRKSNVVVSGLPESESVTDERQFLDLCAENLKIKPRILPGGCIRLGSRNCDTGNNNNRPRRLLVRLSSESSANDVIRKARDLRQSADAFIAGNVFINRDLSLQQRKLAYEARERRRLKTMQRLSVQVNNDQHASGQSTEHEHKEMTVSANDVDTPPEFAQTQSTSQNEGELEHGKQNASFR